LSRNHLRYSFFCNVTQCRMVVSYWLLGQPIGPIFKCQDWTDWTLKMDWYVIAKLRCVPVKSPYHRWRAKISFTRRWKPHITHRNHLTYWQHGHAPPHHHVLIKKKLYWKLKFVLFFCILYRKSQIAYNGVKNLVFLHNFCIFLIRLKISVEIMTDGRIFVRKLCEGQS